MIFAEDVCTPMYGDDDVTYYMASCANNVVYMYQYPASTCTCFAFLIFYGRRLLQP